MYLAYIPAPAVAAGGITGAAKRPGNTETTLIERLQARDERALQEFENQYGPELKNLIGGLIADAGMAQDVWQECLLRLWRSFPHYTPGRGSLSRWAWYICRNVAVDELRAPRWRDRQRMQPLDQLSDTYSRAATAPADGEDLGLLALAEMLKPAQRTVIDLMYRLDLTQAQTAQRLNLPEGTVKTRARAAYRALSRLAACRAI